MIRSKRLIEHCDQNCRSTAQISSATSCLPILRIKLYKTVPRWWMTCRSTLTHRDLPTGCSYTVPNFYKETHQPHTNQHQIGNSDLEQGRPQLCLQKLHQFQVQKTNPKTSLLCLVLSTTFPLLCVDVFLPEPVPFSGSTVLSLTRGLVGDRTTTGSVATPTALRGRFLSVCWCKSPVFSKHTHSHSLFSLLTLSLIQRKVGSGLVRSLIQLFIRTVPSFPLCAVFSDLARAFGQPEAPVSSKACAHGSDLLFSESVASSWPTRWVSGGYSGFPWLRRCNAL